MDCLVCAALLQMSLDESQAQCSQRAAYRLEERLAVDEGGQEARAAGRVVHAQPRRRPAVRCGHLCAPVDARPYLHGADELIAVIEVGAEAESDCGLFDAPVSAGHGHALYVAALPRAPLLALLRRRAAAACRCSTEPSGDLEGEVEAVIALRQLAHADHVHVRAKVLVHGRQGDPAGTLDDQVREGGLE